MLREADMELLQRDLDNDLSWEEKERLQALLSSNPDLQLMQERLRRVSMQLAELPPVTPPYSLVDAILPQLEKASVKPAAAAVKPMREELPVLEWKQPEKKPFRRKQLPVWLARVGTGIAAACLLLGIFVMAKGVIDRTGTGSRPVPVEEKPAVVETEPQPSAPAQEQPDKPDVPQQPDNKQPAKGQPAQPNPPANKKQAPAAKPQKLNSPPAVATTPANEKGKAATPARPAIIDDRPIREKDDDKDNKKEKNNPDPEKKREAGGDRKNEKENKGKDDDKKGNDKGNGRDNEKGNGDGRGRDRN
ncbi:hypothetical protein G3578_03120 [Brevibacillus sp. SYP-B805]|uniref:anti-sigma factor family protein n=1 Tax=Brevibacillus sp. SYP-B805 TaxID=1578199 RepID=UPI0013EA82FE|nr:hypothetical protein [Brevibacillus sp. SYP-B805]NGQ94165.1 hypothetical protein [Brevibacillus sp. SYP-B805]